MSTICEIKFVDRENAVFFAGEILRCSVLLRTSKPKCLQEISALVSGKSKVRWTEGIGKHTKTYRNKVTHLDFKTILRKDHQADNFELNVGTHLYNFEIQLPNILPSSYQGKFGETQYEVKLTLARAWKFNNEFIQPFTLICPVDLTKYNEMKSPTIEVEEKTSHLNCCKMQPIRITVKTPHSGYIPGQYIPVSLEVSNSSQLNCSKIVIKLHRHAQFFSSSPCLKNNYTRTKLMKIELPGVPKFTNRSFSRILPIPPTPPTSPQIFDFIRIWYTITVEAVLGLLFKSLKMFVPMTIGTIPRIETIENGFQELPLEEPTTSLLTHMYSFKESQPENKSFVDEERNQFIKYGRFIPKYPVFNNPQTEIRHYS